MRTPPSSPAPPGEGDCTERPLTHRQAGATKPRLTMSPRQPSPHLHGRSNTWPPEGRVALELSELEDVREEGGGEGEREVRIAAAAPPWRRGQAHRHQATTARAAGGNLRLAAWRCAK